MAPPKAADQGEDIHAPRIAYLIKQVEQAIRAELDLKARDFGLTALQYTALTVLLRHPGMSGAQMARRSFVSPQAGSEMIANLERKGFICRTPDSANRRVLRISLTSAGNAVVDACEAWMEELEQEMMGALGPTRQKELRAGLGECLNALSRRRGADRRP